MLAAEEKPEVRRLPDVKPLESEKYGISAPLEITSAEELAKSPAFDDTGRAAAKKAVNFATEKLVVFAWSGSGRDRLTAELQTRGPKKVAVFYYKMGETDDLHRHTQAYAVPKDATVELKK